MAAKINHLAIVSENYTLSGTFYEALFKMKTSGQSRRRIAGRAIVVGDGYVGININPRRAGRAARFDHFGIEVDDVEATFARLGAYPEIKWLKRPSNRPYAGITTHDPDGNVFDLSQRDMSNRKDLYAEEEPLHQRHVSHFALRTLNPEKVAAFYREVFDFAEREKKPGDPNTYLTDGHLTLAILPWNIGDYAGTGIASPSLEHIGFAVESLDTLKSEVREISENNPRLAPFPVDAGSEDRARLELSRRSCPFCEYHLADVDGVLISAHE